MKFQVIGAKKDISDAFNKLSEHWKQGSNEILKKVRWRPQPGKQYKIWWREGENIWGVFELSLQGSYEIYFGLSINQSTLEIGSQFCLPASGCSRKYGGLLLLDSKGRVYLGHTGKIGGGKPGVGRSKFLASCKDKKEIIGWPDGKQTEGFSIAEIESPDLPEKVRLFTELRLDFIKSV